MRGDGGGPRVLVPGAGSGAANSLVRSLRAGIADVFVVGCHDDRFVLKKSVADRKYLVPAAGHPRFLAVLKEIVEREQIGLIVPLTDFDVDLLSRARAALGHRVFLPSQAIVDLCMDKYDLTVFLDAADVPVAATWPVTDVDSIEDVISNFAPGATLWCRTRIGTGSIAATSVKTAEQARNWIRYWHEMRGIAPDSFTISEYLPGRDFACQAVWKDGRMILVKTVERLSYFGGWNRPSGVSSIAQLARTVNDPRVVSFCTRAIQALGDGVSGAFSVDLKENREGVPCITEINVGRFITMMNLFDLVGTHNMSATYVRVALDDTVEIPTAYDAPEDYYFIRDVDTLPAIFHADELFEDIEDAGTWEAGTPGSRHPQGHMAAPEETHRVEISGALDGHALEALRLEIRRLARRHGVEIKDLRVEQADEKPLS